MKQLSKKRQGLALVGSSVAILSSTSLLLFRKMEWSESMTPGFVAGALCGTALVFLGTWLFFKKNRTCK